MIIIMDVIIIIDIISIVLITIIIILIIIFVVFMSVINNGSAIAESNIYYSFSCLYCDTDENNNKCTLGISQE